MQHPRGDLVRRTAAALALLGSITTGAVLITTLDQPVAFAQPDIPCEQWQQMHPGWPCIPVPKPPPAPPPGTPGGPPTTAQPAPAPVLPGQAPNAGNAGGRAGALTPPVLPHGAGTPIVPVPGARPPALPGDETPNPERAQPGAAPPSDSPSAPARETVTSAPSPPSAVPPPSSTTQTSPTPATSPTSVPESQHTDGIAGFPDRRIPFLLLAGMAALLVPMARRRFKRSADLPGVVAVDNEIATDPGGTWVTDYSKPLASPHASLGPYSPDYKKADPDTWGKPSGWTKMLNVADPADPNYNKLTLKVQYRFRVAGMEATQNVRVVERDGQYFQSRYYRYDYQVQKAYTVVVGQEFNHEWVGAAPTPRPWENTSLSEIMKLQSHYPGETFFLSTPQLDWS